MACSSTRNRAWKGYWLENEKTGEKMRIEDAPRAVQVVSVSNHAMGHVFDVSQANGYVAKQTKKTRKL